MPTTKTCGVCWNPFEDESPGNDPNDFTECPACKKRNSLMNTLTGDAKNKHDPPADVHERIAKVASTIQHCGDYGDCFYHPEQRAVFWNMADSDDPDNGLDDPETIKGKFLSVNGVEDVHFGNEHKPKAEDGWHPVVYESTASKREPAPPADPKGLNGEGKPSAAKDEDGERWITVGGKKIKVGGSFTPHASWGKNGKSGFVINEPGKQHAGFIRQANPKAPFNAESVSPAPHNASTTIGKYKSLPEAQEAVEHHLRSVGAHPDQAATESSGLSQGWEKNFKGATLKGSNGHSMSVESLPEGQYAAKHAPPGSSVTHIIGRYKTHEEAQHASESHLESLGAHPDKSSAAKDATDANCMICTLQTDGTWYCEEVYQAASDAIILSSDVSSRRLRVRQKATRADALNGNNRIYPRAVVQDAINRVRERAQDGLMLSEFRHPEVAVIRGDEYYIDNPDLKTASVDDISDVGPDGWVTIDRTIKRANRHGQAVSDAIETKEPYGISMRFKMKGHKKHLDGKIVHVADWIDIHTWDDVPNPAVTGAGQFVLLSDSQLEQIERDDGNQNLTGGKQSPLKQIASAGFLLPDLVPLAYADALDATQFNRKDGNTMPPKFQKALNTLNVLVASRAPKDDILKARKAVSDAMKEAENEDEDGDNDMTDMAEKTAKADAMIKMAGYCADAPSPAEVQGSNTTDKTDPGFAPDVKDRDSQKPTGTPKVEDTNSGLMKDGLTADERAALKAQAGNLIAADAEKKLTLAIDSAVAACDALKAFNASQKDYLLKQVADKARVNPTGDIAKMLADSIDALSGILSPQELDNRGGLTVYHGSENGGQTTYDHANPASRNASTRDRGPIWMEGVDKLLAAGDDYRRRSSGFDPEEKKLTRAHNMKHFINPLVQDFVEQKEKYKTPGEWFAAKDDLFTGGEKAFVDRLGQASAAYDAVTLSNLFNQPTISLAMLIQAFQDLEALPMCEGIGPRLANVSAGMSGWGDPNAGGRIGSVLRIPVEYYTPPSGWGTQSGTYDALLATPENTGIDEATINTVWLPFTPTWKRIAISLTRDAIRALGNGPLNYPAVARALFHINYDKARRIDKALFDNMLQTADEYGTVAVTEVGTGASGSQQNISLANNTVYNATAGGVTVNLNPTKLASAAVVAGTDTAIVYGTAQSGNTSIGAIRLATAQIGGTNGTASPYTGTTAGTNPVCHPRPLVDLNSAGQIVTNSTLNNFTVTTSSTPATQAAAVLGYLDAFGNVQTLPGGGATANYAIDYNNGVLVFTAGLNVFIANAGVAARNTGGFAAANINITYSYVTNFDNFQVNNLAATLVNGLTLPNYLSSLLGQHDITAAKMGSAPRFVKPNVAIMSLNASTNITQASIFYKFNSPDGTSLFPTENFFYQRSGIMGARINAPWNVGDSRILFTRKGTTKYGIDTPFELRGPYPAYDANGKIVAREIYYGEENSVICTPVVQDQNGNILNPPSRTLILR